MAQINITTKTTIPTPTGSVTVTGQTNTRNLIRTAGTGFLTMFGKVYDDRNFIYIAATSELLQVTAVFNDDLIQVRDPLDPTFSGSAAVAAVSNKVFADLLSYSFVEVNGVVFTENGVSRAANFQVAKDRDFTFTGGRPILLPVRIDATGGAEVQVETQ